MPFVTLGRNINDTHSCIIVNERTGFRSLVNILFKKGHRRIAYIGGPADLMIQVERFSGFCEGLENSGLPRDENMIVAGDLAEEGGVMAVKQLMALPKPPTAILGCNDLTALGAMRALQEMGFIIGKEIAVAGYDGIRETEYTNPPLTTIYQPTYEIARQLVSMLVDRIEGNEASEKCVRIDPQVIIRASTG